MKIILALLLTFQTFAAQSPKSFELLLKKEGFRSKPYDDITGKTLTKKDIVSGNYTGTPTIGYGTVIPKVWYKKDWLYWGLSKKNARKWAKHHPVRKQVNKRIARVSRALTQDQEDVLHEVGYNIGPTALGRIIQTLNKEGFRQAAKHLMKFTQSKGVVLPGLVKRRKEEAKRLRGK